MYVYLSECFRANGWVRTGMNLQNNNPRGALPILAVLCIIYVPTSGVVL